MNTHPSTVDRVFELLRRLLPRDRLRVLAEALPDGSGEHLATV